MAAITHHELCYGCGQANLFGLQIELNATGDGQVAGRLFLKQDHQGPPGVGHGGIMAAALDEAMALLVADQLGLAVTARLEIDLRRPAPIGTFVHLDARVERTDGRRIELSARARTGGAEGELAAEATGVFVRLEQPAPAAAAPGVSGG